MLKANEWDLLSAFLCLAEQFAAVARQLTDDSVFTLKHCHLHGHLPVAVASVNLLIGMPSHRSLAFRAQRTTATLLDVLWTVSRIGTSTKFFCKKVNSFDCLTVVSLRGKNLPTE